MRLLEPLRIGILVMGLLSPLFGSATEAAGVRFAEQRVLQGQPLVLNGVGVRAKMIVKVYAMGLYLSQRETSVRQVLSMPGAKCVRIVMLRDVSAERLAESLIEGLHANTPAAEEAALRVRVDELESAMLRAGEAHKGVAIELSYTEGMGTRVSMGDQPLLHDIPGEDFYRALLRIWLGDKPSDQGLKDELLGL